MSLTLSYISLCVSLCLSLSRPLFPSLFPSLLPPSLLSLSCCLVVSHSIHRKSLQPLLFGQSSLKSHEVLSSELKSAEERVSGEDQELQQVRQNYLQKSMSRKRHRTGERRLNGIAT